PDSGSPPLQRRAAAVNQDACGRRLALPGVVVAGNGALEDHARRAGRYLDPVLGDVGGGAGPGDRGVDDGPGRTAAVGDDAVLLVALDDVLSEGRVADLVGVGVPGLDADAALAAAGLGERVGADVLHGGPGQGQRR